MFQEVGNGEEMGMTAAVDTSELVRLQRQFPKRNEAAMATAIKAEARRLNLVVKKYAASEGEGEFLPYAPATQVLRKRKSYGAWFAPYSRYFYDARQHRGFVGIITAKDVGTSAIKFKPISRLFGNTAKRMARGYSFQMTRKGQRAMAAQLEAKYERVSSVLGDKWRSMIPRVGTHRVKPRPVIDPVFQREQHRSIRNMKRIFITKIQGGRYSRDWATEWGSA